MFWHKYWEIKNASDSSLLDIFFICFSVNKQANSTTIEKIKKEENESVIAIYPDVGNKINPLILTMKKNYLVKQEYH